MKKRPFSAQRKMTFGRPSQKDLRNLMLCGFGLVSGLVVVLSSGLWSDLAIGQNLQQREDQVIRNYQLPTAPAPAPIYQPAAPSAPAEAPVEEAPSEPEAEPAAVEPSGEKGTTETTTPEEKPTAKSEKAEKTEKTATEKPDRTAQKQYLGPLSQYVLEFNRSPAMGNRMRIEGVFGEQRLGFTRPNNWQVKGAKAVVRFQHSPALVASRSNLIVRVNDTAVGTVPLNLKDGQIGEAVVTIPPNLIQDYNDIAVVAQQENSQTCSTSADKSLWTEVLPDSKLVMDYQVQGVPLDFSRYPYPFFDPLALDSARLSYLAPTQVSEAWMTAASRLQATMGRLADFRPMDTQLVKDVKGFKWNDRLIIVGTPEQQPALKGLKLPLSLVADKFQDGSKSAMPDDVGLLMLTTLQNGSVPVLVVTGNSDAAVTKAAQFLSQQQTSQIGTSALVVVNEVSEVKTPNPREWPRFVPDRPQFNLSDLKGGDGKAYQDVTVKGASSPPVEFNFRALPDDRFVRGSSMTLRYSYSAQVDTSKSTVSVFLGDVGVGSKKLASDNGASRESFTVDLPEKLLKPNSKIRVAFNLVPKGGTDKSCGRVADQQLFGTVHGDTQFNLKRQIGTDLPDLKLLTVGYPFTAPQDLSRTAIVLPDNPSEADVMTLLKFSERLGRISQSNAVKHEVYKMGSLPQSAKEYRNLVGIGTRDRFPLPQVFEPDKGFRLMEAFAKQMGKAQIQTLPDNGGVIKTVMSPWSKNGDRVVLALTAQTDAGLKQVQDVLGSDAWFYQLQSDTALLSQSKANPSSYDPSGYQFQFLQQSPTKTLENLNILNRIRRFLQSNFLLLPTGIILLSLLMYGIAQLYLKRVAGETK
jgi:cellulose synthase operon protein B